MRKRQIIGASSVPIPVDTPVYLAGHINRNKPAYDFLDPLQVHVLYGEFNAEMLLLISVDVLEIDSDIVKEIKKNISKRFDVNPESIIITCTHTHTAPAAIEVGLLPINRKFIESLTSTIIKAIYKARSGTKSFSCRMATTTVSGIGINRRKIIDGRIMMAPNSDKLIDSQLHVLWVLDEKQKPIAVLVNYSMHPTTIDVNTYKISSDYPHYLRQVIHEIFPECEVFFLNGACGDVRPNIVDKNGDFCGGDVLDLELIGQALGKKVLGSWYLSKEISPLKFKLYNKTIRIFYDYKLRDQTENSHLTRAYAPKTQINPDLMEKMEVRWRKKIIYLEKSSGRIRSIPFYFQILLINRLVVIVFLPAEIFTEIGLRIKKNSPFQYTLISAYSDGSVGYIPMKEDYEYGGYEVEQAYKVYGERAPFECNTADRICDGVLGLLKEINCQLLEDLSDG